MTMRRYRCLSGSTADWELINLDWTNLWVRGGIVETDDELAWEFLASDGYEDITDEVPSVEAPDVDAPDEAGTPEAPSEDEVADAPEAPAEEDEEEDSEDVETINKVVEPAKEQAEVETVEAVQSAVADEPERIVKAPRSRSRKA